MKTRLSVCCQAKRSKVLNRSFLLPYKILQGTLWFVQCLACLNLHIVVAEKQKVEEQLGMTRRGPVTQTPVSHAFPMQQPVARQRRAATDRNILWDDPGWRRLF